MSRAHSFIRALHGLRGIAVLYVLFSHFGFAHLQLVPFIHYSRIGKMGVMIFFVLSAFLLTGKLRRELIQYRGRPAVIGAYLTHRFFRIYPVFLIVLGLHVLAGHFDWYTAGLHLLLQAGFRELWAIPVEFKYYFCMPLIALLAVRFGGRITAALLLAGCATACAYAFVYPDTAFGNSIELTEKLAPFLAGSALALILDDPAGKSALRAMGAWLGWVALALLAAATVAFHLKRLEDQSGTLAPWILVAVILAASGLIAVSLLPGLLSRLLGGRPLVFFGEISFSLYLLHEFVAAWVRQLDLPLTLEAWIAFLAATALAWLSYICIERPGIKLGYRIGAWLLRA